MPSMVTINCHNFDVNERFTFKLRARLVFKVFGEEFAIHKRMYYSGLSDQWILAKEWKVSHRETGYCLKIPFGWKVSNDEIISDVVSYLRYQGKEKFFQVLKRAKADLDKRKLVPSPEYFEE